MRNAFITGIAGFTGFHLAKRLTKEGFAVYGCDVMHGGGDQPMRLRRKLELEKFGITVLPTDVQEIDHLQELFAKKRISHFFHLATLGSVRSSGVKADSYGETNIMGFLRLLESIKPFLSIKLFYLSSSAVYGNEKLTVSESDSIAKPTNLYAATKGSCELLAHAYHQTYGIHTTIIRPFTIYGPYNRADSLPFLFANSIMAKKPITLFQRQDLSRDFLYIDDFIDGIVATLDLTGFHTINLGSGKKESISDLIRLLEKGLGKRTEILYNTIPKPEIAQVQADLTIAKQLLQFSPKIDFATGVELFTNWFLEKPNEESPVNRLPSLHA